MTTLNTERTRNLLRQFDFANLFVEELGWDRHTERLTIPVDADTFLLQAVAEKRGFVVFVCASIAGNDLPVYALRRKIERETAKSRHEHLIVYVDSTKTTQVWQWVKREPGKPDACREKSIILNNLYGVDIMAEAVEICRLRLFLKMVAQVNDASQVEPLPDIDFNIRCGNTLVGFATYKEVKEAVTTSGGKQQVLGMIYEDRMDKIELQAQDLQQAFDIFRRRQVEGDGSVPHADKARVRERLAGLEDELNKALAGKYGINAAKDKNAYATWLASHQPFHWFIEYYGIMAGGGFDVIIGNPPYVEYSKVSDYRVRSYTSERCANLYTFTVERSIDVSSSSGRIGLIIPISLACSGTIC